MLTPQRFLPRITVIKAEGQRNAITCRHCEDAPCVRSCPNDAIAQSGDSVQVRQEKCIGCKSCMVACPFGVMQVVVTPQAAGLVKAQRAQVRSMPGAARRGRPVWKTVPRRR